MEQTINNLDQNKTYILSIQVSLNGLSFCTINSENKVIHIEYDNFGVQLTPEQVLDKLKYLLDHNQNLKYNFDKIEVVYHNDLYTVIPKALFNEELLHEYLRYNVKLLNTDFVAYDELDNHEMMIVYVPYTNINNFFFETFGSFTYKHTTTVLIDNLLTQEKNKDQVTIFANIHSKFFDLVIIEKGKLLLANTYPHESKEDFLYYLMFATEQLKLNPEEFLLHFLGDISVDSEYCEIAYKYIRNVDFGKRNNHSYEIEEIENIESHQHFVLLSRF